jgi:hypothetical protein
MPTKKPKPTLEQVTAEFGKAHTEEAEAKSRMEKYRKQFFDLLKAAIPKTELARQTIYYEGDDPDTHIATLYPKWKILKKEVTHLDGEWRILIEEDPERKSWQYINPQDGKVYRRTVKESAPSIDTVRLQEEDPGLWEAITIQPPPPERVLKPLSDLDDEQKDKLRGYLLPPKLTNVMEKPREAKAEEVE